MRKGSEIVSIAKKLLIQPRTVITNIDLISYDKDVLNNFFVYLIICNIIINSVILLFQNGLLNIGVILLAIVVGPFIIIMYYRIFVLYFYLVLKVGGKEVRINHEITKTLLNPILLVHLFLLEINFLLKTVFENGMFAIVADLYVWGWLGYTLFLLLWKRLKQTRVRSVSILILLMVVPIIIVLVFVLFAKSRLTGAIFLGHFL